MNKIKFIKKLYILPLIIWVFTANGCTKAMAGKFLLEPHLIIAGGKMFAVYFNDPGVDRFTAGDSRLDMKLVELIDKAENTLDIAVYNFNRMSIIEAILRAYDRGVRVRMVGDQTDSQYGTGYKYIFRSPIPISVGNAGAIQHNKFAIIDKKFTFMGTANFSDTDLMKNNNNVVVVESKSIAEAYTKEFEQMFYGRYGGAKIPVHGALRTDHTVNGIPVEVYFSPYGGEASIDRLIELVDNAKSEIHYMIFAFTHDELSMALVRAAKRGVVVRGVHDFTFVRGVSMVAPQLYAAGTRLGGRIEVREDGNENTAVPGIRASGGKLHTKTMIIDRSIVATGSFNWSNNAVNNNDENLMIIHSPLIAGELISQWNQVYGVSNHITANGQVNAANGDTADYGDVVISEVLWAGAYSETDAGTCGSGSEFDGSDEFVELRNMTNRPIDVSHWSLSWESGGRTSYFPFPDSHNWYRANIHDRHYTKMVIPPNGYLLLRDLNRGIPTADARISGVKNYGVSSAGMRLRLYDIAGNLIDEAGDGGPPFAGFRDTSARKVYSMERFFHPDTGKPFPGNKAGSWYTANLKTGQGVIGNGYQACTIGTPNYSGSWGSNIAPASTARFFGVPDCSVALPGEDCNVHYFYNHPVRAWSLSDTKAVIQMRWAMVDVPQVYSDAATFGSSQICSGTCVSQLNPSDPSQIIITTNPQNPGSAYSVKVQGSENGSPNVRDANSNAYGGNISFTGYGMPRAKVRIETVAPRRNSLTNSSCSTGGDCHYVELLAQTEGTIHGLGLYAYTYENKDPVLIREFSDVPVRVGDRIRVSLRNLNPGSGVINEDNRAEKCPVRNTASADPQGCTAVNSLHSFLLADRNSNNTWDTYSQAITTFGSGDAVIFLKWKDDRIPTDLMCYSNRDGTIAFNLETAFRQIYAWGRGVYDFGVFPILNVNNSEMESRCVGTYGDTSNWRLERAAENKNYKDFILIQE